MDNKYIYLIAFIFGVIICQLLYTGNNFNIGGQTASFNFSEYETILNEAADAYENNTIRIINDLQDSYSEDYCKKDGIHSKMCDILTDVASDQTSTYIKNQVCAANEKLKLNVDDYCNGVETVKNNNKNISENDIVKQLRDNINTFKAKHKLVQSINSNDEEITQTKTLMKEIDKIITNILDSLIIIDKLQKSVEFITDNSEKYICNNKNTWKNVNEMCTKLDKGEKVSELLNLKFECNSLKNSKTFKENFINCCNLKDETKCKRPCNWNNKEQICS